MPTNEQRRATAKRKLERQLERRAAQARRRRLFAIIGGSVGAVLVVAAIVTTVIIVNKDSSTSTASTPTSTSSAFDVPPPEDPQPLPAFAAPAGLGENCEYAPTANEPASKANTPPRTGKVPTDPAEISASMTTNQGNIGLQLDNAKAPCTVNSFSSLAQQGYFDNTPCHRLTTSGIFVLQCGDPTGKGTGGPGYQFPNEYPTNQFQPDDPALQKQVIYPRGTIAMANAGPGTNGSQFFLVYKDSPLAPGYTAFGKIDDTGLATLEKIATAGEKTGSGDGEPTNPVEITNVRLD